MPFPYCKQQKAGRVQAADTPFSVQVFPGPTLAEVEKEQAEGREKGRIEKKFRNVLLAPDKKKKDLLKGPPVVTYKLIARSHARSSNLEEKTLPMIKVPVVVNDIKEVIEILFDIPVATQKLTHNLKELHNDDKVVSHNIVDGDTLEVTVYCSGSFPGLSPQVYVALQYTSGEISLGTRLAGVTVYCSGSFPGLSPLSCSTQVVCVCVCVWQHT